MKFLFTTFMGLMMKENGRGCPSQPKMHPRAGQAEQGAGSRAIRAQPHPKQNQFCLLQSPALLDLFCSSRAQPVPRFLTGREHLWTALRWRLPWNSSKALLLSKSVKCYYNIAAAAESMQQPLSVSRAVSHALGVFRACHGQTLGVEGTGLSPWALSCAEKNWVLGADEFTAAPV